MELCTSKGGVNCGGKRKGLFVIYKFKVVAIQVLVVPIKFMDGMNVQRDNQLDLVPIDA